MAFFDLAAPNCWAAPLLVFYTRDDATARRVIWLRQMRDEKRRECVRSTLNVAPSHRRGYKTRFGAAKSKTPSNQKNANQDCSRLASFMCKSAIKRVSTVSHNPA